MKTESLGFDINITFVSLKFDVVTHVSLFNWASYRVSLARNFSGEQRDIRRGHFFNVNNREILNLEERSISQ